MYKLGLASIAFRQLSVEDILTAAKAAKLSYVEWGSDIHAPKDDVENLDRIVRLTREAGLQISSYGTYFNILRNEPEELIDYIHAAKRLGTSILRIWCAGNPNKLSREEILPLYEKCRQIAKIAEAHDVLVCAECHNDNLTDNKESSLELLQSVNSPAFRMYWQPNPYHTDAENEAFAKAVSAYAVNVHVYNWQQRERLPLAQAADAWRQYVRALGEDHVYLLEHFQNDDPALLAPEAEAFRQILATV